MDEVVGIIEKLADQSKDEALFVLASEKAITRNTRLFERVGTRQAARGFKVRIISPVVDQMVKHMAPNAEWCKVEPLNITFFIFDRKSMLLVQYANPEAETGELAVFATNYTTNKQTILGMAAVFDALWREIELLKIAEVARGKEERARRQAELLQDILTHDIRNYNQITRLSAELLSEELGQKNDAIKSIADNLLASINGSSALLERVRNLSKIISESNTPLYPVDVLKSIQNSFEIVKRTFPDISQSRGKSNKK
jgi:signal transduction histidine kinase